MTVHVIITIIALSLSATSIRPCSDGANNIELNRVDRTAIQTLYGQCTGRFDGAFDWLHTDPDYYLGRNCMQPCQ